MPLSTDLLSWVTELWGTCLFRPGYLQTWAQFGGGHE